jgi:hypothetical protein
MRHFMMTVMALAAFGATVVTAQAENQTPNPPTASHPVKKRTVSHTARPTQTVSAANSTCTGMKAVCLSPPDLLARYQYSLGVSGGALEGARPYNEKVCNFFWEQCMKTGFWEGALVHRPAERR